MDARRRRLILDHLHGLLTLEQVGKELGVNTQRAYQLKQKLWNIYHVPEDIQRDGPACARWVAAHDHRLSGMPYGTPGHLYHFERFKDGNYDYY